MGQRADVRNKLVIGWQEWVALPDLGLVAIKGKVDTGAKTSALDADDVEVEIRGRSAVVVFTVKPTRSRPALIIRAEARLVGMRMVTSSNGKREERPVIVTPLSLGGRVAPIELTLTNRGRMTSRMLIGRQALQVIGTHIDPTATFLTPKLGYKLYPGWRGAKSA